MILTCPSCSSRYLADPASLQPSGRMVRCANCGHSWFQKPPDDMPRSVAGAGNTETAPLGLGAGRPARRFRKALPNLVLWLILGAAILGVGALGHQYRVEIVRGWPQAATLYGWFGVEVNIAGMEFRDFAYELENEDGLSVLTVQGTVANVTDQDLPIPRVRVSLFDDTGGELYSWTVVLDQSRLEAGASTGFTTRLSSPPPGMQNVEIRFAEGAE